MRYRRGAGSGTRAEPVQTADINVSIHSASELQSAGGFVSARTTPAGRVSTSSRQLFRLSGLRAGREHARRSYTRPPADAAALRGAQLRGDLGRLGLDQRREPLAERVFPYFVLGQDVARDAIARCER